MISKALPIAVLTGATAVSAACPLSIEITDTTNHIVNVAVTNTGSDTITVFKGNTVLSEHATKDLLVADMGKFHAETDLVIILRNDTTHGFKLTH